MKTENGNMNYENRKMWLCTVGREVIEPCFLFRCDSERRGKKLLALANECITVP